MSRGVGNNAPRDPITWLVREVRTIKTQIQELMSGRRILNAAEIDEGGLSVVDGGSFNVLDQNTSNTVFFVGYQEIPDGSGRKQMSVQIRRDDNSAGIALGDFGAVPGHAHQQVLAWYARLGRVVVADDTIDGTTLANPHIETGGLQNSDISTWPATNAQTFTTIAGGYLEIQNPRLTWQVTMFSETGVTSQFRMLVNGTQVGSTQTVPSFSFGSWSTIENRPSNVNAGDVVFVELQALSSASSGKAKAQCYRLAGWQS